MIRPSRKELPTLPPTPLWFKILWGACATAGLIITCLVIYLLWILAEVATHLVGGC